MLANLYPLDLKWKLDNISENQSASGLLMSTCMPDEKLRYIFFDVKKAYFDK